MYHRFFIHSSVDGHLSCFHILTIENCAATNIGDHVSFSIMVFSGYMPSSGVIREIQIKTIMREQLIPVGMAIIKKNLQTINAGEDIEKRESSCTVGNVN